MLKLSTLLSKLDFSTLGDLRADLVGEAERLEGVEEVREAIKKECGKADAVPVKERRLLKCDGWKQMGICIELDQHGHYCRTHAVKDIGKTRADYPGVTLVQVMAPDENNQCPTQYVDNVQLGCEIEWAIYGTGGNMWLCPSTAGREYTWRAEPFYARRWESRNGAQSYINIHKIDAAIPFPVPKLREAK